MLRLFNFIGTRFSVGAAWGFLSWGLPLAALLAGAAGGGWAAWQLGRAPLRIENADLRETHAETIRLAALAGARRLQLAQERSDLIAGELLATLATNHQLTEERTHALTTATTGRACLSGSALRVLHGSPGITVAGVDGLPPPRPGAAAAHAAAAAPAHPAQPNGAGAQQPAAPGAHAAAPAPELEATDTDTAIWIAQAGNLYETCRARLHGLHRFHATPSEPATQEPLREPAP